LGEWRYSSTYSLTSALDGGEWSASRTGRFTPRKRAPGTPWIGGWVGSRTVLEAAVKRKFPAPPGIEFIIIIIIIIIIILILLKVKIHIGIKITP
jgi:hypothetical protein